MPGRTPAHLSPLLIVAVVAAIYGWAARLHPLVLLVGWGDGFAHLTAIRRTVDLGLFPGDLFYAGGSTPPYYSLSHVLFALAAAVTNRPPHELFAAAPPAVAFLACGAVFLWLRALGGSTTLALAGAAVELLVGVHSPPWVALSFPRNIALVPLFLCWAAYVRGRRGGGLPWLLAAGVALGACLATHLFTGGLAGLGLLAHEIALARERRPALDSLGLVAACGLLVASPWIASFVVALRGSSGEIAPVFRNARDVVAPSSAWPSLVVLHPRVLLGIVPATFWLPIGIGLAAALIRTRRGEARLADRYALVATSLGLLACFTPLLGLALALLGAWTVRLVLLVPFSLLVGLGVEVLVAWVLGRAPGSRARPVVRIGSAAALAAVLAGAVEAIRAPIAEYGALGSAALAAGPLGRWDLATLLERSGPLPRVVLSDPQTSYAIPYHLGSYVIAMPAAHGSPYADHLGRERAVREFYSRPTAASLCALVDRWGVDAVAVAPGVPWPPERPGAGTRLLERLRAMPGVEDSGCCGPVVFLRLTPALNCGARPSQPGASRR